MGNDSQETKSEKREIVTCEMAVTTMSYKIKYKKSLKLKVILIDFGLHHDNKAHTDFRF